MIRLSTIQPSRLHIVMAQQTRSSLLDKDLRKEPDTLSEEEDDVTERYRRKKIRNPYLNKKRKLRGVRMQNLMLRNGLNIFSHL